VELQDRMRMTVDGQVTWADPSKEAKCSSCRHIGKHKKPKLFKEDQCKLVFLISRQHGVPFDAKKAIACSKYEV
jgi:hypothetical protein